MSKATEYDEVDVDAYVESFQRYHLAMMTITFLVCLTAWNLYKQEVLKRKLEVFDVVMSVNDIASDAQFQKLPPVTPDQLLDIANNQKARNFLTFSKIISAKDAEKEGVIFSDSDRPLLAAIDFLSTESSISQSHFIDKRHLFLSPGQRCEIGFFGGASKRNASSPSLVRDVYSGGAGSADVTQIYIANFSEGCLRDYFSEKSAIVFPTKICEKPQACGPTWMIGLPEELLKVIVPSPDNGRYVLNNTNILKVGLKGTIFNDLNNFKLLHGYNKFERMFISSADNYIYFPFEFYRNLIFELASEEKNKIYKPNQFEQAISDLFDIGKKDTDFGGMAFDTLTFLCLAPFFVVGFIYVLHRRIGIISLHYAKITKPWLLIRNENLVDFFIALLLSFAPTVCFLLVGGANFFFLNLEGLLGEIWRPENPSNRMAYSAAFLTTYFGGCALLFWITFLASTQMNLLKMLFVVNQAAIKEIKASFPSFPKWWVNIWKNRTRTRKPKK